MDHCHQTGEFRKIVCQKCNCNDSYIKYPDGYDNKAYQKEWRKNNLEKIKQYLKDNSEEIKKYKKEYNQNNQEKIKEYRQKNSERIHKRDNEKHNCQCGGKYTHCHKLRHMRSKKHLTYLDNNN